MMDQFLDTYIFPYTEKYFGRASVTKDGLPVYTQGEEIFNTVSHSMGIAIGIATLIYSVLNYHSDLGLAGGIIFGVSLIVLYLASSVYHGIPREDVRVKKFFRIVDHCSIFILIAGTCTPFILDLVGQNISSFEWAFYAVIWFAAIGGITLLCVDMKKYTSVSIVMYVIMGVALVVRANSFAGIIGETGMWLLIAGGAMYLLGLLFYGLGSKRKWMHSVFHVLCLIGSMIHCVCICRYVI